MRPPSHGPSHPYVSHLTYSDTQWEGRTSDTTVSPDFQLKARWSSEDQELRRSPQRWIPLTVTGLFLPPPPHFDGVGPWCPSHGHRSSPQSTQPGKEGQRQRKPWARGQLIENQDHKEMEIEPLKCRTLKKMGSWHGSHSLSFELSLGVGGWEVFPVSETSSFSWSKTVSSISASPEPDSKWYLLQRVLKGRADDHYASRVFLLVLLLGFVPSRSSIALLGPSPHPCLEVKGPLSQVKIKNIMCSISI